MHPNFCSPKFSGTLVRFFLAVLLLLPVSAVSGSGIDICDRVFSDGYEANDTKFTPYAIVHYFRDYGDYGNHTTGDFNDYWGLHLWGDSEQSTD